MSKLKLIEAATRKAQESLSLFTNKSTDDLEEIYNEKANEIRKIIKEISTSIVEVAVLQRLLDEILDILENLSRQRNNLLIDSNEIVIELAIGIFNIKELPPLTKKQITGISERALKFVYEYKMADGLNLSDRLWRLDRQAEQRVAESLQSAVIKGQSASQAAQEFLARKMPVPEDLLADINGAKPSILSQRTADIIMRPDGGGEYYKVHRLFRTELARAHSAAYEESSKETGAVGIRFMLSPSHRVKDICDKHASANKYGLGKGVYPFGQVPFPAHPNTTSWTMAVYDDQTET